MDNIALHGFWYYNWGNVVSSGGLAISIIGVFITVAAFREARSAKQAAEEARSAARFWSHSDEVRRGESLSRDLANLLGSGDLQAAFLRIRDLLELLRLLVELWTDEEGVSSKEVLSDCRDDADKVQKILRRISGDPETGTANDTDMCAEFVDRIYSRLLTVRAAMDKKRG
jgi:hypothetical protein